MNKISKNPSITTIERITANLDPTTGMFAANEFSQKMIGSFQSPFVDMMNDSMRRITDLTQPKIFTPPFESLFDSIETQKQLREAILRPSLQFQNQLIAASAPFAKFSEVSKLISPAIINWSSSTTIDYNRLFSTINKSLAWSLPDLLWEEFDQHRADFLLALGLQFLLDSTDDELSRLTSEVIDFAVDARSTEITKHIHKATSSDRFANILFANLGTLPNHRGRIRIISAAIRAHSDRDYLLSIPALLPQVEALTMHLLAKAGYVKWDRSKRKWFEINPDSGEYVRRGPQNRLAPVTGLGSLEGVIKRLDDSPMPEGLPYLQMELAKYRNGVLHGNLIRYDRPRESSKLLLLTQLLATNLVDTDGS